MWLYGSQDDGGFRWCGGLGGVAVAVRVCVSVILVVGAWFGVWFGGWFGWGLGVLILVGGLLGCFGVVVLFGVWWVVYLACVGGLGGWVARCGQYFLVGNCL